MYLFELDPLILHWILFCEFDGNSYEDDQYQISGDKIQGSARI